MSKGKSKEKGWGRREVFPRPMSGNGLAKDKSSAGEAGWWTQASPGGPQGSPNPDPSVKRKKLRTRKRRKMSH